MFAAGSFAASAAMAERWVLERHLRRFPLFPIGRLGVITRPAPIRHRLFLDYHYWWQAHLLDCLVDAELRAPDAERRTVIRRLPTTVMVRNRFSLVNDYFDDVAWMALAMGRAATELGIDTGWRQFQLARHLHDAWDEADGGIPWRRGDAFRNVPANGSMAILMARLGRVNRARAAVEWIDRRLLDDATHLILEGVRPDEVDRRIFTYNQGLVVGAELELVIRGDDPIRLHRLVAAIREHATRDGVLQECGGGDGGLFAAITARYLTRVARLLPGEDAASVATRERCVDMVTSSADAAWRHAAMGERGAYFGPDWTRPAVVPGRAGVSATGGGSSVPAERDLSVQLAGWMVQELAASLEH